MKAIEKQRKQELKKIRKAKKKAKRELKKLKRKGEKLRRNVEAEAGHTDENFANDGL